VGRGSSQVGAARLDLGCRLTPGDPPKLPDSLFGLSSELGGSLSNRDCVEHCLGKLEHCPGWLHQPLMVSGVDGMGFLEGLSRSDHHSKGSSGGGSEQCS